MQIQPPNFANQYNNLTDAINIANRLLKGEGQFFEKIRDVQSFDLSWNKVGVRPVSGADIVPLYAQKINVTVERYWPWYVWSKALASTVPGTSIIHLNARSMNRPTEELVATLMHECVHILDKEKGISFGHGNNYATGKSETAPYRIEKIAIEALRQMTNSCRGA